VPNLPVIGQTTPKGSAFNDGAAACADSTDTLVALWGRMEPPLPVLSPTASTSTAQDARANTSGSQSNSAGWLGGGRGKFHGQIHAQGASTSGTSCGQNNPYSSKPQAGVLAATGVAPAAPRRSAQLQVSKRYRGGIGSGSSQQRWSAVVSTYSHGSEWTDIRRTSRKHL
jgi:hypothetical protein